MTKSSDMAKAVIILAAGKGTRMKSQKPKVLHKLAGATLLEHCLRTARKLDPAHTIIVTGYQADQVAAQARKIDPNCQIVHQEQQLGTGHAVAQARAALTGFNGTVLVLYADSPLIGVEKLEQLCDSTHEHTFAVLGFHPQDPARYGRLVMEGAQLNRIVEYQDATIEERNITFCNSAFMAARADALFDYLERINQNNQSGEYYLTDVVGLAVQKGHSCTAIECNPQETLGVNSPEELAQAETIFQARIRGKMLAQGVTMLAPETVYFSYDTVVGTGSMIEQNVVFSTGVTLEEEVHIRAFSHLEQTHAARGCVIGPYARLRPGTTLNEGAKIGNFVEVKAATIHKGAKVNHLSYIGDANVGAAANIGAGTITCNYDGVFKHKTDIGAGAFVGSNTLFVAPVQMGAHAMTGSGTVVTQDIPPNAMAIARTPQRNIAGLAKKFISKLNALKQKHKGE